MNVVNRFSVLETVVESPVDELLAVTAKVGSADRFLLKRLKPAARVDDAVGLRNEWEVVSRYRLGCMLEPVEFIGGGADSAILYRYVEGAVDVPPEPDGVLARAEAFATALGEVHAAGLVHGDLQPGHILFGAERAYLVDFSRAQSEPRLRTDMESIYTLRRNLHYIAPEQTGRLNRRVDYRGDYYSYGAILYQWLTGRLPFAEADPLELVYAHLTRVPERPERIRPDLPPFAAEIVLKLLAKDPDHRYQSIEGLLADLAIARGRNAQVGSAGASRVGAYDVPYHFTAAHKLYGRETERVTLLQAYDRACRGEREAILISGYSGIGKTSLIRETYLPVTRQKAYFVGGKFDQLQRTRPYSAWIEALHKLMMLVLAEPEESLDRWRRRIGLALGPSGVLAQLVPEIATLLGPLPPPPELPPAEALHRFNDAFRRFLGCFCLEDQPLSVFLDDLQWIDGASLNLLEVLLRDPGCRYLFLIGAYRDNEVQPGHPLLLALDRLKREGAFRFAELTLQPLDHVAVRELVADTFALPDAAAGALSDALLRKTDGNPFFLWQMLQALRSRGDVRFDTAALCWTWDPAAIERLSHADNVLELMQVRLRELPEEARKLLALAACLGLRFELDTLAALCGQEPGEVFRCLQPAREAEFILPDAPLEVRSSQLLIPRLRFLHDRLQEAAYRSIEPGQLAATHLRIARLLMSITGTEWLDERIFAIADHLNQAIPLLKTRDEGLQLARLNRSAALRARASSAYEAALRYAESAMARLPDDLWDTERDLARALYRCRGDLEYLNGRFDQAESFVRAAIEKESDRLRQADLIHLLVVQYTLRALYPQAIDIAREGLRLLGVILPEADYARARDEEFERVRGLLAGRPLARLAELPAMQDPEQRMVMTLLIAMGPPCYRSHPGLWSVIVAQEVRRCLEYGNVAAASYTYPAFGGLLVHVGRGTGRDCAELRGVTERLMASFDQPADTSVGYLMMGSSLTHWHAPLAEATRDYLDAYRSGLDSGNLQYAVYAFGHNTYCRYYQGVPLGELIAEAQGYLEFCRKRGNQWGIQVIEGALRVFSTLHGGTADFSWNGEPEAIYLARLNLQTCCIYHALKAEALWHLGRPGEAASSLAEALRRLDSVSVQGLLPASQIHLVRALLLADAPELLAVPEAEARRELAAIRQRFERWAEDCPANFSHLSCLIRAEEARLDGDVTGAMEAYDEALDAARAQGFHQRAGLIAGRAALFWTGLGKRYFAEVYQRQAGFAYRVWQAGSVQRQADNGGGPLSDAARDGTAREASASELDQQALLSQAQALSQPLSLDELVLTVLRTAAQVSGAQRTVLLLQSAPGLTVAADTADTVLPTSDRPLDLAEDLPRSVCHYVARTGILWRLAYAGQSTDALYLQDEYFRRAHPLSVLCLPLGFLGELGGLLYLEHFELGDAFDANHTTVLEGIAGHAAIAIRNARLFETLQREIAERKQAENELRRYQDHLEEVVQQRTADLVLARNAAEAADKAKSVFLANMSHELRTPLNAILGFSNLMRRDAAMHTEHRGYLDIINRSGEHLLDLINDVLEMSKIEAGRVQVEHAPLDFAGLVADVADMMRVRAEEKGLALRLEPSATMPRYICGDAARLRQVLINLVGNAIKFTQAGAVTVRLGTALESGQERLLIEVEDTGAGISPEDQAKIFDAFVQLGKANSRQGTGLGLALTRQYVTLMDGAIHVDSTPGRGARFLVELPLIRADMNAVDAEVPMEREVIGLAPGQPRYRVLIVEDQPDNWLLLDKLMKDIGFETRIAENGELAMALFQDFRPHLIWMDRRMPVLDGIEATRRIRALPGGRDVKIIGVTASAFAEQCAEMLQAGMDDVISKPYRFQDVYACLARQLGVEYAYADTPGADPAPFPAPLTTGMLAGLPETLRQELREALLSLESDRIQAAINRVADHDPQLQGSLARLADNYDYPAILGVL